MIGRPRLERHPGFMTLAGRSTLRGLEMLTGVAILTGCGAGEAPPASQEAGVEIWREGPRLPAPVTNNAVAAVAGPTGITVLSFLGMDSTKVSSGVTWRGRIDRSDPSHITWDQIPLPPGAPLYRAAGGTFGGLVVLAGGTDNPYNYSGIGYDGAPSSPMKELLGYDAQEGWVSLPAPPVATMDHRTLGHAGGYVFLVGGMVSGQRVSDRVWYADVDVLLAARSSGR